MQALRKSTFVFGKARPSLILPRQLKEGDEEDAELSPIRWITVDFVSTPEAEKLEVDVHAFIFTHDGEYIDCVFYKNPVLAGKSVRLQGTTLFIDLHMLPARAGFIVITLAVYSGGTLASLTKCCTQVRAYIAKDPTEKPGSTDTVEAGGAGSFPSPESHWEAVLATMDITSTVIGSAPDAKGLLNCLLAEEEGSWFLKALLQPVAAFTPHALIESAQRAVRHFRLAADNNENTWSVPFANLLDAAMQGKETKLERTDDVADYGSEQDEYDRLDVERRQGDGVDGREDGSVRSSVEDGDAFAAGLGGFERLAKQRDGYPVDDGEGGVAAGGRERSGADDHRGTGDDEKEGPGRLQGLERFEKKTAEGADFRQGRRWTPPEKVAEGEEEGDYFDGENGDFYTGRGVMPKRKNEGGADDGDAGEEDSVGGGDHFHGGLRGRRGVTGLGEVLQQTRLTDDDSNGRGDSERSGAQAEQRRGAAYGGEDLIGEFVQSTRSGAAGWKAGSGWSGLEDVQGAGGGGVGGGRNETRGKGREKGFSENGARREASAGSVEGISGGSVEGVSGREGGDAHLLASSVSSSEGGRRKWGADGFVPRERDFGVRYFDSVVSSRGLGKGGAGKEAKGTRLAGKKKAEIEDGVEEEVWRHQIEGRLEQLEKTLTGVTRAVQQIANGTKDMSEKMQEWFSALGGKLSRLQSDVEMQKNLRGGSAADFGMTSEPFDGRPKATKRRDSDGEDQESVNRRLQDLSRLVTLGERSQQQISQSITELKTQLAGFERRLPPSMFPTDEGKRPANPELVVDEIVVRGQGRQRRSPSFTETTAVEDADDEGEESSSPRESSARRCCCCCCCSCPCCTKFQQRHQQPQASCCCCGCVASQQQAAQREGSLQDRSGDRRFTLSEVMARTEAILRNVEKIDEYGEELGDLLRCLASCTAPDGLKGLDPVEKKLLTFAGTPKTFEALHTFESALDRLRVCGAGLTDH